MKKSSVLIIVAALILSSCGALTQLASSDDGQRFQDGIYSNTPSFRTKAEKEEAQSESQALARKTKESMIYLFGDKKDTVAIPQDMSAMIRYDQKLGGTVVTVGENPYDWRYDLENNYGYYYGPYSIGSSWYWSRHYSPWYSWDFAPWRYRGWYDGWYYGSWYSPYYYGGFYGGWYDPWYWGWYDPWYSPYYNPYYCGWYGGWDPYWGHHHHHGHTGIRPEQGRDVWYGSRHQTGSERVFSSGSSLRGGIGTSSTVSRNTSGRSTVSRVQASGGTSSRTDASGRTAASTGSTTNRSSVVRTTPSIRNGKTAVRNTGTAVQGTSGRGSSSGSRQAVSTERTGYSSQSNHRRPAVTTTPGSSADRSSSSGNNSGYRSQSGQNSSGYDRSASRSSSSYNRSSSSSSSRSSYSSGSSSSYSRGSSGGGYSGGGSSRSGGSSGGRR